MTFCLPKFGADALRERLVRGDINPDTLSRMTSQERRQTLSFLGEENAKKVNALFESKLLLKNQQQGMINWAKQVLNMKPQAMRDAISKVERNSELLTPDELDMFLEDLVEKKLGINVTIEEAGKLADMAKRVEESKGKIPDDSPLRSPERLEYGLNLALFKEYVESLKIANDSPTLRKYIENPTKAVYDISGAAKSLLASLDNSFFGRQGIKMMFTNPDIWGRNFLKSWGDIAKSLGGGDPTLLIKADIFSRPNALNGNYARTKTALGIATEEAFPSSLPTRIPILGRLFKASEQTYNGAALRMRADLMDRTLANAEKAGIDITDVAQAESLGKLVNSMTGRGGIGRLEVIGKELNAALFSIKFLKSNFDTLTAHQFDMKMTPYARKQAALNTLKIIGGMASTLAIAEQLWPGSVETDPRSSNFGKIKIGNTRFDITGGMGSMVVLASRLATGEVKSSVSGKITELNKDTFGALTKGDILLQFAEGKTSPALKAVIDNMTGSNFKGETPTLKSTALGLVTPLPFITWQELQQPGAADPLIAMILSQLGIGVNTYSSTKK